MLMIVDEVNVLDWGTSSSRYFRGWLNYGDGGDVGLLFTFFTRYQSRKQVIPHHWIKFRGCAS